MKEFPKTNDTAGSNLRQLATGRRMLVPPAGKLSERIEALRETALALLNKVDLLEDRAGVGERVEFNLHDEVRRYEIDLILRALQRTQGHQVRAARLLGIKVTTLNSKIKRYGIGLECFELADTIPLNDEPPQYRENMNY